MKEVVKKHASKIRFAIVGGTNTAIDFIILFILVGLGLDRIFSNFISTSTAFLFSFFANRSFTFKARSGNMKKQFGLFLVVTLFGLWIIQPIVIESVVLLSKDFGWSDSLVLFAAKLFATLATLVWNYLLYSKFVFKKDGDK